MAEYTFECEIFYSQIALFQYGLDNPFNDWNDTHVNQGFTWREGSVSFGTLGNEGNCEVTIKLSEKIEVDDNAIRAIVVPFKVKNDGIEVGSIIETVAIDVPEGRYELLFFANIEDGIEHYTFVFVKNDNPIARVLKADDELSLPENLLMQANPAI